MRYGEKRTATILFKDPTRKSVFLDLEGEGMKEFHNFTFIGQNRDTDHGIKEVQVTLPSALLKVKKELKGNSNDEYKYIFLFLFDRI